MPSFVKAILAWLLISMLLPGICLALVLLDMADPYTMSNIALPTVLASWIIALLTALFWPSQDATKAMRFTAFVVTWSFIAIFFPLSWDLPWAILHEWVNGATAEDKHKWYFWAYAVADTRFLRSDPVMICVEYWSGIIGIIEIISLTHFVKGNLDKAYRFFVIAGCLQLYGCSVFFGMEYMHNFENIRPDIYSYIKFFGMNGMWITVPPIAGYLFLQLTKMPEYDSRTTVQQLFGKGNNSQNLSPALS